jgi:hypothetical protein
LSPGVFFWNEAFRFCTSNVEEAARDAKRKAREIAKVKRKVPNPIQKNEALRVLPEPFFIA